MRQTYIPYGAYWSTPFARWQGSLSHLHPMEFAAHVARSELARRKIESKVFDFGVLDTKKEKAKELSARPEITIRLLGFGLARTDLAFMPQAPVPAARAALKNAGLTIKDIDAVKSHNPFAVNDIVLSREFGFDVKKTNNYGCSLVWGHPQGPPGLRAIMEMIEELVMRGGGRDLFHGCTAGDSALAAVLEVTASQPSPMNLEHLFKKCPTRA